MNNTQRKIDITKATLFILFAFIFTITVVYFAFVPDIKRLKIASMTIQRANITLEQAKAEHQIQLRRLDETKATFSDSLALLSTPFSIEGFHSDTKRYFADFELTDINFSNTIASRIDRLDISTYTVSVVLKSPNDFYGFAEYLNSYRNVVELALPISIKINEEYGLKWDFGLKVFRTIEVQSPQ